MELTLSCFVILLVSTGRCDTSGKVRKNATDPFKFESIKTADLFKLHLEDLTLLRFMLDFATWTKLDSIVLFASNSSGLLHSSFVSAFSYFNKNGIYVSFHSTWRSLLPKSLSHRKHRIGAIMISAPKNEDFLTKVSDLELFDSYRTWLFIIREHDPKEKIKKKVFDLKINFESNVIVSHVERPPIIPVKSPKEVEFPSIPVENRNLDFDDEFPSCHQNKELCANKSSIPHRLKRQIAGDSNVLIHLNQIYKVSKNDSDSVIENYLGSWDTANGLANVEPLLPVQVRTGLMKFKMMVGVKNASQDSGGIPIAYPNNLFHVDDDDLDEDHHMSELLDSLMFGLNISYELVHYSKLGWQNEEGGWTHLLGAVVDDSVDFALDTMDISVDKSQELMFSYPIVKSMSNIYFRRPDAGGMRDIFLIPFSSRLILCVFSTGILLSIAMISITLCNYQIVKSIQIPKVEVNQKRIERSVVIKTTVERKWEVSEAALWSVSIICMQGSPWSPNSTSGSLLLIFSLVFALIIYNSYAAFITSVLSVADVKIKTLDDLLSSEFAFGYTIGGPDENYLRTVNDSKLKELYFKGLKENDGVTEALSGVQRAATGSYAFFTSARTARRALLNGVAHDQRCGVQELFLKQTKTVAALPLSKKSHYKNILNYKILRMMETGILHRFQKLILPSMPICVARSTFNSARLTDVYSAFTVLAVGWVSSAFILFVEIIWHKRQIIGKTVKGKSDQSNQWLK